MLRMEESLLSRGFPDKKVEEYFATIFEGIRPERSLFLLQGLVEPDFLEQSKFTDHETDFIKNLALEKMHRKRFLKETVVMDLLEKQFSI